MADNRLTRELATRAMAERPKQWMPPELLPEPDKMDGYAYRWIRVSNLSKADPRNVSSKPVSYTHLTLPTNREV